MKLNSIMTSQLRSLQSTVQLSVLNKTLQLNSAAATEMLKSMPNETMVAHPHKGISIDVKT